MIRTYLLLAALGLATAACGGQGEADKAGDAGPGEAADTDAVASFEAPDLLTAEAGPDGVVPGGAVDVLRREGWRVAGQPAPAPAPNPQTPG